MGYNKTRRPQLAPAFRRNDGTTPGGGANPAGPTGAIQFNAGGGALGGANNATIDPQQGLFVQSSASSDGFMYAGEFGVVVNGPFTISDAYGLAVDAGFIANGGAVTNIYGIKVEDQTHATNNWAIKTGAGMVEVGDATKAAGIHVQGAGAFDVDGFGTNSQLWIDIDDSSSGRFGLALTNRTAGLLHGAGLRVMDDGSFQIAADINGIGGTLTFDVGTAQWSIGSSSLQVSSWISTTRNTAPADNELANGELAYWGDPTNGAAKAMFKMKQADGTVRTGSLALS